MQSLKVFSWFGCIVAILLLGACKKDDDTGNANPPVVADANFYLFPKTGGLWISYGKQTDGTQKYDTLRIGSPSEFTVKTYYFGYDSAGSNIPKTHLFYPVIITRTELDTLGVLISTEIDTVLYIREDTATQRMFRLVPFFGDPFASAENECLIFDYSLKPGQMFKAAIDNFSGSGYVHIMAKDSIYFNQRYLYRYYVYNDAYNGDVYNTSPIYNPFIVGFSFGTQGYYYNWPYNTLHRQKFIYNGLEVKKTYLPD